MSPNTLICILMSVKVTNARWDCSGPNLNPFPEIIPEPVGQTSLPGQNRKQKESGRYSHFVKQDGFWGPHELRRNHFKHFSKSTKTVRSSFSHPTPEWPIRFLENS